MPKRIHIVGAGGVAGIGLTRCLKNDYEIQGHDQSQWAEKMAEANIDEGGSIHFCDMLIPVPDKAVLKYAEAEKTFLPTREEIELCQDKAKTAQLLRGMAPKTYWVRDTHGAGGSGAQMCSEFLPGRNYSVELLYDKGELIGQFTKERLAYDLKGSKEPTKQMGSSAVSKCIKSKRLEDMARTAVEIVADHCETIPHGVYAIDFKENEDGQAKITEINPGRFLTASYVYFYSTGYNLPLAMVKRFFNEEYKLGQYPEGIGVIRQTDCLPYVGAL